MQGNQSLEIVDSDRLLSKALGYHFNENCCGILELLSFDCEIYKYAHANLVRFKCKKCQQTITFVDTYSY